ncbi:CDP-diacylglycerol--glycerol-3-phosphate 3-phosphatidyltransferase [Clostridia bacterium]|nr:CDP-diacylglycerol--glycerol-3-phosphate 3-phosphatidyltransferase [Clostridia bacterium]
MNLANKLTILRVLMIPVFLVILFMDFQGSNLVAAGIFVLASLTDFFDGYIARSRNMITTFGKFADPLADKLLVAAALIAEVQLGNLTAWFVIVLISREFIITGFRLVAASKNIILAAGFSGKIKTAIQMVMIIYVLIDLDFSWSGGVKSALLAFSLFFSVYSACEYIAQNKDVLKD